MVVKCTPNASPNEVSGESFGKLGLPVGGKVGMEESMRERGRAKPVTGSGGFDSNI